MVWWEEESLGTKRKKLKGHWYGCHKCENNAGCNAGMRRGPTGKESQKKPFDVHACASRLLLYCVPMILQWYPDQADNKNNVRKKNKILGEWHSRSETLFSKNNPKHLSAPFFSSRLFRIPARCCSFCLSPQHFPGVSNSGHSAQREITLLARHAS